MANIGPTSAFYNVETSVTRSQIEINKSLERIATGKQIANLGDGAAVANMVDEFRLDFVGTKAGIKSAAVVMGYLETGMRVLNSAGTLLSRLQELAVLGASDLNTTQDHEAVNTEAEAIAQEFNRLMSNNSYKGKNIFVDTTGSEHLSMGSQNSAMTFGIGKIDYSNLFGTARSVEEGLPNAGQVVNLTSLPSDAVLSALIELETKIAEQYLEVAVSSNLAQEDNLSLNNTANVTIDENNVISYNFNHADHGNVSIEIGEIDPTSDGSQGVLKINFYDDATIPDSGNLVNGDFESGTSSAFGVPTEVYSNAGFEHRVGMVNTFAVQNAGNGYVEFNDTLSTLLTRGSNTYSISFDSNGAGTGFRANVLVADDGSLSIAEVLDKGQGYSIGEILTVAQDARGIALAGSDFSISITSTLSSNDTDPGRNADNIHEVTQPNFQSVTYTVENGPDGRYDWGESYIEGTAQKIATNDGTGNITNYIHAVAGNYASDIVMIDGVAQPLFTDVYENDDVAAGVLIVENFIPTFAQDDAILEQVSVADYVANTGGNNNGTETAFYAINPVDGQRVTTNWTYDEYTTGVSDGSIISTGATVTQQISGVTNILADDYDGGGPQFIDTPNFGIGVIAVGDELPTDNVVYNLENSSGIYDWGGGSYTNGSIVKDPTGSDFTINIRHAVDGVYTFDVSGTDFDPADLNYSAGDEALEFVTWADQFDPDNPPVGSTVYRTDIRHDADGTYTFDVSGTDFNPADLNYSAGDDPLEFVTWADQFDPDNPPVGSTVYRTDIRHDADGTYTFDVSGSDFNPADLNYSAGDDRLEFFAWADQFDPDSPPAGSTVYRTDIRHDADGAYTFDVSGSDFNPADLNYYAGDDRLEFFAWADQFDPDSPPAGSTVYRTDIRHDADGAYTFDVSGSDFNPADLNYYAGDDRLEFFAWADQFDPDNPPAGSTVYRTNNRHDADGAYTFDVSGTNFNPVGLNYNAGDVRLEFVAWADQFDPDNPPAGSIVYRTDDELATPAFFTRAEEATPAFFTRAEEATPEFFTRTEEATPLFFTRAEEATPEFFTRIDDALAAPEFFTRSAGTVSYSNSVSHYERPVITDYDRQEITGYSREEIAFYTRNKQLRTAINTSGQVEKYLGESRITNNPDGSLIRAHVGWERDNQVYINNWTTYDDRVEFGSNFEIYDTDGTYAWNGDGSGFDPEEVPEISIPTPTLDQMAKPNYGTFTRLDGSPGNPAVRNRDDAVNVPVLQSGGEDVRDYSDTFSLDTPDVPVGLVSDDTITHPFSGTAMELFTGKLKFEDSAAFGIYHGPAIVSDQFRAEEGQVLRLNYNAAGDVDDYHVAGYIYEVDPNTGNPVLDANGDAKIMMALNETGTVELDGRASVDIEADGDYRFVFIVGTFDKTGGLAAGASMRIDNIVAEFKYSVDEEAVAALLQAVNYSNDDIVSNETSAITSTLTNSNGSLSKGEIVAHLEGSDDSDEADGPITVAATLLSALNENENEGEGIITSTTEEVKTGLLTSKIDRVQRMLNKAREQAGSQYSALESLVISTTDLTAEYESKYKELYNVNLSDETALLAKRQMLAQSANAFLAQAGEGQQHLLKLLKDTQKSNTPTY